MFFPFGFEFTSDNHALSFDDHCPSSSRPALALALDIIKLAMMW